MKFNSQICTSREQSERLLKLGLKKETADMCHRTNGMGIYFVTALNPLHNPCDIPAWSLHRLIEMIKDGAIRKDGTDEDLSLDISGGGLYDGTINAIEWLIKEGYFNKEYLVDQDALEERCKGVLEYLDYIREED